MWNYITFCSFTGSTSNVYKYKARGRMKHFWKVRNNIYWHIFYSISYSLTYSHTILALSDTNKFTKAYWSPRNSLWVISKKVKCEGFDRTHKKIILQKFFSFFWNKTIFERISTNKRFTCENMIAIEQLFLQILCM